MPRLVRTVTVDAPVEKVFALLSDPSALVVYWPGLQDVRDIKRLPNGGTAYRWPYTRKGVTCEGTSEDTVFVPNERIVTRAKGGINSTLDWTFDAWDGATIVTVELDYELAVPESNPLIEAIIVRHNEREFDALLDNIVAGAPEMES